MKSTQHKWDERLPAFTQTKEWQMAIRQRFGPEYDPSESRILACLRKQRLTVAAYCCLQAMDSMQTSSTELMKAPYEDLLHETPAWTGVGVFLDQCGADSALDQRPAFRALTERMAQQGDGLVICRSLDHFHSDIIEALKGVVLLDGIGVSVYSEEEDECTLDKSVIRNLMVFAQIEEINRKVAATRRRQTIRAETAERQV